MKTALTPNPSPIRWARGTAMYACGYANGIVPNMWWVVRWESGAKARALQALREGSSSGRCEPHHVWMMKRSAGSASFHINICGRAKAFFVVTGCGWSGRTEPLSDNVWMGKLCWPLPGGGASVSVGVECLDGKDL